MMALTGGRPLGSLLSSDRPRPSLPASPIFAPFPRQTSQQSPLLASTPAPGLKLCGCGSVPFSGGAVKAINGSGGAYVSPWDEEPYEILPSGKKAYLDEQDVVTFLDPPKELIPLDPASYNPAAYLWKKIEDIPEERRHRLLHLLNPRLIFRAWEIAGTRYEDPKLAKKSSSKLLSGETGATPLEYYYCQTSGGPFPISWINFFKMAIFCSKEGQTYGRLIGETILARLASSFHPLYFVVRPHKEVMSTEQPCDLACEFGDGLFDLQDYPEGFPKPGNRKISISTTNSVLRDIMNNNENFFFFCLQVFFATIFGPVSGRYGVLCSMKSSSLGAAAFLKLCRSFESPGSLTI
ncbi:hypothetical protein CDL15_Pgr013985 [Punica granatum]|uniref:Uncharacterized protein n=1 Tax=Punica granatum TaxID=22663 RepID=A0A218W9J0_PUNGR|nr:hypothetical protein CDL15_Pgr013985 [Punica granatum]